MKNSYTYVVYTAEQDKNSTTFTERENSEYIPGYYADVLRVPSSENLLSLLNRIGGLKYAHAFPTLKEAKEVAAFWNEGFRENGTYLFA